jgi:hypothetical protein
MSLSRRTLIAGLLSAAALNQVQAGGIKSQEATNAKKGTPASKTGTSSIKFTNNTGMVMKMGIVIGPNGTPTTDVAKDGSLTSTSSLSKLDSSGLYLLAPGVATLSFFNFLPTVNANVSQIVAFPISPNATDEYFLNYDGTAFSISTTKVGPPALLSVRRASTATTTTPTTRSPFNIRNYRGR